MTATPSAPCPPEAGEALDHSGRAGGVSPLLHPPQPGAAAPRSPGTVEVPDPPPSPKGRARYWADTVQEAVAELRRQIRSHDPDRADRALFAIVDVEKTRMRHGRPVSGTSVPCLPDLDDDWGNPIATKDADEDLTPPAAPATLSVPERVDTNSPVVAGREAGVPPPLPRPTPEEREAEEEERAVERFMAAVMMRIEQPRYANWHSLPPLPKCFAHLAGWPQPPPHQWPDDPPGFRDDKIGTGRPASRPASRPPLDGPLA